MGSGGCFCSVNVLAGMIDWLIGFEGGRVEMLRFYTQVIVRSYMIDCILFFALVNTRQCDSEVDNILTHGH